METLYENKCLNTDGAYSEERSPREKGGEAMSRTEEAWGGAGVISGHGEQVDAGADGWRRCWEAAVWEE